ncbi:hypothetical protein ID062_16660 [Vibrio cholerae]|uniref:hypothetical protein n=1 Tax=Vibrio cholerae TaxID=666 RepID=UPI001A314764|nr:hypothetical protein [Vibrio cholerae]BCN19677.1 hypothetical protein [Vibrio cholerae]GHX57878.1 hypothetical protein VCSRO206_2820 [Vibrio cholerae]GHZ26255.1 hypothetical protein VCSRO172_2740 [Vibrio cholerae]HAS3586172.1 hypothetical protein [Vibrio cholerae]
MLYSKSLFAGILFVVNLLVIYVLHVQYFKIDVVFYSAIFDGVLAAILTFFVISTWNFFSCFSSFERVLILVIYLLGGYAFAISVPTVIDRSLSFYILEKIDQRGGGIKLSGFKDVFVNEYLPEHRLVDVRITEQLSSGTIFIDDNNCVKLTEKGKSIIKFSLFFRHNLLPKQRLLMGEYSSDLTNPFANVSYKDNTSFDYTCE